MRLIIYCLVTLAALFAFSFLSDQQSETVAFSYDVLGGPEKRSYDALSDFQKGVFQQLDHQEASALLSKRASERLENYLTYMQNETDAVVRRSQRIIERADVLIKLSERLSD